ncbi:hypothetical protein B0I31_102105 [Saccharothrix carnea]|uniref:Pentapeptide repeat protein n=2 Tax=Saccharothrix carnea TaxID=1280637 RepID=A0A2P8IF78_SACCR|nr:hypothetical protein B0I31_102105 [Saccharothrix carnea]
MRKLSNRTKRRKSRFVRIGSTMNVLVEERRASKSTTKTSKTKLLSLRAAMTITIVVTLGVLSAALISLWWALDRPQLASTGQLGIKDQLDLVRLALIVTGGIGGLVALVVAYRKQKINETAEFREETKLINEHFNAACAQLGHDSPAVRMAGVYALASVADEWSLKRQSCIDVLCGYIRLPYEHNADAENWRVGEREVRLSIIRVLSDHLQPQSSPSWIGYDLDFTGAVFDGGDFTSCHFSDCRLDFTNTKFVAGQTLFHSAKFTNVHLEFENATFQGGDLSLRWTRFQNCTFWLTGIKMIEGQINFSLAKARESEFTLTESVLTGGKIDLSQMELEGGGIDLCFAEVDGSELDMHFLKLTDVTGDFGCANFKSGVVNWRSAKFHNAELNFGESKLSGCLMDFTDATFVADNDLTEGDWKRLVIPNRVDLSGMETQGDASPIFSEWPDGTPSGLVLTRDRDPGRRA